MQPGATQHINAVPSQKGTTVAATDVRPKITLACQECKHRNYITKKNRRNDPDRLAMNKFCPQLRQAHRAPRDALARPTNHEVPPGHPVGASSCSGRSAGTRLVAPRHLDPMT